MNCKLIQTKKVVFIFLMISTGFVRAQFINGDFSKGKESYDITSWTNSNCQYVENNDWRSPGEDAWLDLTGTGYGYGKYIEQTVYTSKCVQYEISFDISAWPGWDFWDAEVIVTMDGKNLRRDSGGRFVTADFSGKPLSWRRMKTVKFWGTGAPTTFRFTSFATLVQSYGYGSGVGVIGFDDVKLDSFSKSSSISNQFVNGDFEKGSETTSPHTINDWSHYQSQYIPDNNWRSPNEDGWIDLTGTGFGAGKWVEQTINTSKCQEYQISFDISAWPGWDFWDAEVIVTMDGKNLGRDIGGKFVTADFSGSPLAWHRMKTVSFWGTDAPTTFRFTSNSTMVTNYGYGSGVGVVAFDDVSLDKANSSSSTKNHKPILTNSYKIVPNPVLNTFQIYSSTVDEKLQLFELKDMTGKIILSQSDIESNTPIDLSNFKAGTYNVFITTSKGVFVYKLLKTNN